eukprot:8628523-Ditylum_brightwellii.AAC.1
MVLLNLLYGHIVMYFLFVFEWWMTCPSSPLNAFASSGGGVSTSGAMSDEEQKNLKHEAFQRRRKASGIKGS